MENQLLQLRKSLRCKKFRRVLLLEGVQGIGGKTTRGRTQANQAAPENAAARVCAGCLRDTEYQGGIEHQQAAYRAAQEWL